MGSNLLSASRLRAYRRCPRYEWLAYVEGWRPVATSDALADGTLLHLGLEAWWSSTPETALDAALAAIAGKARDAFVQVKFEELLRGYETKWRDQTFTVLAVEEQFNAPLLNPKTMAASRTWRLVGKVDARVADGGRSLIVEHKSSSEDVSLGSTYWVKLSLDPQISMYFIGAESLGYPVEGCIYDVVKKPALRPSKATPEADRKYKKDGVIYGNQREFDETPEEFRLRVRASIEEDPDKYFVRREIPRTESQIVDFLTNVWDTGKIMREGHLAKRAIQNPDACHQFGVCGYWKLCSVGASPENDPGFQRLDFVHPELSEELVG